jgi:hypothetical protein
LQVLGEDDLRLNVIVSPRASRTRIMGVHDDRLKIQIAAPPADGKANQALVRFLAETLGITKAQVEIVGGGSNTRKTVRLSKVTAAQAVLKLSPPRGV